ncbi:hypothetical protein QJR28_09540 [Clostridium baratii]|uniref:hypothetical protein n=1 Tax=Clostridium baratii TaxID=1561 RepID=UPI0030D3A6B9
MIFNKKNNKLEYIHFTLIENYGHIKRFGITKNKRKKGFYKHGEGIYVIQKNKKNDLARLIHTYIYSFPEKILMCEGTYKGKKYKKYYDGEIVVNKWRLKPSRLTIIDKEELIRSVEECYLKNDFIELLNKSLENTRRFEEYYEDYQKKLNNLILNYIQKREKEVIYS